MCSTCSFADVLNELADASVLSRDQRRAFAELYVDDPSGTAETLARRAERCGRNDLASRVRRTDSVYAGAVEDWERSFE
jgi:hypothetical protein